MKHSRRILALVAATSLASLVPAFAQLSFTDVTPTGNPYFATNPDEDFWANAVAPADVDGDGDLDLAVIGFHVVYNVSAEDRLVLLRNDGLDGSGEWTFTSSLVDLGTLTAGASDLAWGDFDSDGDPDLVVGSNGAAALYRNETGTLVPVSTSLPQYGEDSDYTGAYDLRSITWADVDNDGDPDLLVPSVIDRDTFTYSTRLLRNDGADDVGGWQFTDLAAAIDPTVHAQSSWADDDDDGDLDYLVAGAYYVPGGNGLVEARMHLYRNAATGFNAPPAAPEALQASPDGNAVVLSWLPSVDDHTSGIALTYDLRVHATGAAMATAKRQPEPGNLGAVTGWALRGLAAGSYTWSVSAIDSALVDGPRAAATFTIAGSGPTPPVVADGRSGDPVKVVKTRGAGTGLIVSWDAASCSGALDHHIVHGAREQLPSSPDAPYELNGSACAVGADSPFTWLDPPDPVAARSALVWFLVIASDGLATEGPWGDGPNGRERLGPGPGGASGQCGMLTKSLANSCGR